MDGDGEGDFSMCWQLTASNRCPVQVHMAGQRRFFVGCMAAFHAGFNVYGTYQEQKHVLAPKRCSPEDSCHAHVLEVWLHLDVHDGKLARACIALMSLPAQHAHILACVPHPHFCFHNADTPSPP
eukprot:363073-Chlamydomonas_euryale.AAC.11